MKTLDLKEVVKFTNNGNDIRVDIKMKIPESLYKFYALNDYSVKGIEKGTIFFSPNSLLNDIMEGNFGLLWDFNNFKNNDTINENIKSQIVRGGGEHKKNFLRWRGIFSMSDDYKNELLWIHYTNESGFCLEFDVKKLNTYFNTNNGNDHSYFFPIKYNNPIEIIDFNEYIITEKNDEKRSIDVQLPILYCLAVKEYHWEYEKEWRLLINHEKFNYVSEPTHIVDDCTKKDENKKVNGNNLEINRKIVTKVILAPNFFNNNRFNKIELLERGIEVFNFTENVEGQNTQKLLQNLYKHYYSCIYQIEKVVNTNFIEREITKKIEIIDVSESYVKLKRIKI
jgi:hypothetical protein